MKLPQSTAIPCCCMSWKTGTTAPERSIVWVPTSKTWTMWGGVLARYAAIAAVSVSG